MLGEVTVDGRANAAGLQGGDRILAVDGEPVPDWFALVEHIRNAPPEQTLELTIERSGDELNVPVTPASRTLEDGQVVGFVGAGVSAVNWLMNCCGRSATGRWRRYRML